MSQDICSCGQFTAPNSTLCVDCVAEKIVAYEIGYWTNDEWVSCEIISSSRHQASPFLVDDRLKYNQSWEMTPEHAIKTNCVGYIKRPHLPGSTIIRLLVVGGEIK